MHNRDSSHTVIQASCSNFMKHLKATHTHTQTVLEIAVNSTDELLNLRVFLLVTVARKTVIIVGHFTCF